MISPTTKVDIIIVKLNNEILKLLYNTYDITEVKKHNYISKVLKLKDYITNTYWVLHNDDSLEEIETYTDTLKISIQTKKYYKIDNLIYKINSIVNMFNYEENIL